MKIILNVECNLFASNEGNGVMQELYKSTTDNIGIVKITDTESDNVITIKKFPNFDDAANYYDKCLPF